MKFASIRMPTSDVLRLVGFWEKLTGVAAQWTNEEFAEIVLPGATVAISSSRLTDAFAAGSVEPSSNRTVMLELMVDDVDAERDRVTGSGVAVLMEPTTLPWGNRSMLISDPDGNVVNLFSPVTPDAIARFGSR
ncbi:VOC family protein [Nakamurella leprariae]|uniref:VOC family protein n=1 Tax=Nakamurella leprariae TaxID=2803911 RepID=A0A939BXH1_9ACTN|nr:VOC family protein [Nakamurella leprariae]MBM9468548.1 VOC family protein [Nakamurella leprariae]